MSNETEVSNAWADGAEAFAEAHDFWAGNWPKALSTGWPEVDKFYTIAPGQMTLLGGIPNHGKSTFMDALMVNLVTMHKFKACVYSPENHPLGVHAWHLIEKYIGKPMLPNKFGERINEEEMAAAGVWLDANFKFLRPTEISVKGVLDAATAAYEHTAYDILVLDPWNEFGDNRPAAINETEWVSLCLGQFRRWARERGVHLFIVVHPRKLEKDNKGNYPVPTAWDLAGSAHWRNKADNILTYWRDFSLEDGQAELHIQKVRFAYVGKAALEPVTLQFHPGAKTFTAAYDAACGNYWKAPYEKEKKHEF